MQRKSLRRLEDILLVTVRLIDERKMRPVVVEVEESSEDEDMI